MPSSSLENETNILTAPQDLSKIHVGAWHEGGSPEDARVNFAEIVKSPVPIYAITDGASVNINPSSGCIQTWTLAASRTPTATFSSGQSVTLLVAGSGNTINWSSVGVTWLYGTGSPPTLRATGYTPIELTKVSSTIYGLYLPSLAEAGSYSSSVNTFLASTDQIEMRDALGFSEGNSGAFGVSWLAADTASDALFLLMDENAAFTKVTADAYANSVDRLLTVTGVARTLSSTDNGKVLMCTNSSAVTIIVASGLAAAYNCDIIQNGTGAVTISGAAGVTLNAFSGFLTTAGQYARASLLSTTSNIYNVAGTLR